MLTKEQVRDIVTRAAWTFVQTFVSAFVVVIPAVLEVTKTSGVGAGKALIVSAAGAAFGAAVSAVKTLFVQTKGLK